jgi:hypothetical protein
MNRDDDRSTRLLCAALASLIGTSGCLICTADWNGKPLDLGIDTDLNAVTSVSFWWDFNRSYEYLAVGDDGTVVFWGHDYVGQDSERFVEVHDLGDTDLRAALSSDGWWVVGDDGFIATTDDFAATWNIIALPGGGTDILAPPDLHAITALGWQIVIVGDAILLVRTEDGTWIEPPTPPGGWGQLRGVGSDNERLYAVGLDGAFWSASDPTGEWIAEAPGNDQDWFDVGAHYPVSGGVNAVVVGAEGMLLIGHSQRWTRLESEVSVDFIDYDGSYVLAADGSAYRISNDGTALLQSKTTVVGARALIGIDTIVGDDGLAISPPGEGCHYLGDRE